MSYIAILGKDFREHGLAFLALTAGAIGVILLLLAQQQSAEFTISGFEVVRFALITLLPLITLITGNRLVVREYTGGTMKFVESLPIAPAVPLAVKFGLGLIFLTLLGLILVMLAAATAGPAEFISFQYLALLCVKTATIISLYWSAVFFVSLTGQLRLVLYMILVLAIFYLINLSGFDETKLPPIALMDRQLFVFERDIIPWRDILGTLAIAAGFITVAFTLALINEGSVAERLGKPLSRRNLAAIVILAIGLLSMYGNLRDDSEAVSQDFSGEAVLRTASPDIEISYLSEAYRQQAESAIENLRATLLRFQADTGLASLPVLQIAHNTNLERLELYPEFTDGVLVTANIEQYNHYDHSFLSTVGLHHMLLMLSNNRWDYESMHWLLDGLSRWWAEGGAAAIKSPNNAEHYARALLAVQRLERNIHPLLRWQKLMDSHGIEAADAIAYTTLLYLAETKGSDTVTALAMEYLGQRPGSSSIESVRRIFNPDAERFEKIAGIAFSQFVDEWLIWLQEKESIPEVRDLIRLVPHIRGEVISTVDENGVYWLEGYYSEHEGFSSEFSGTCVLRHQPTSPFDIETDISSRDRDRAKCTTQQVAHRIQSPYAPGDRSYAALEFENEQFNRPVLLWTGRVHIK